MDENIQALIEAIQQGDQEKVISLLEAEPGLARAHTQQGLSLELLAVDYKEPQIASLLAARRDAPDIFGGSAIGDLERARQLSLDNPDLVNDFAVDGFMPLSLASFFGQIPLVVFLLRFLF